MLFVTSIILLETALAPINKSKSSTAFPFFLKLAFSIAKNQENYKLEQS